MKNELEKLEQSNKIWFITSVILLIFYLILATICGEKLSGWWQWGLNTLGIIIIAQSVVCIVRCLKLDKSQPLNSIKTTDIFRIADLRDNPRTDWHFTREGCLEQFKKEHNRDIDDVFEYIEPAQLRT